MGGFPPGSLEIPALQTTIFQAPCQFSGKGAEKQWWEWMILLRSFRPNFALVKSSRCWFSGGVSKNIPTFPLARSTWNPHKATRCFLMFVVFEDVFCWKNVPILIGMRHNCQSGLKPTTLFCSLPWPHRTIIFCTCAAASRSTSIKKRERIGNSL